MASGGMAPVFGTDVATPPTSSRPASSWEMPVEEGGLPWRDINQANVAVPELTPEQWQGAAGAMAYLKSLGLGCTPQGEMLVPTTTTPATSTEESDEGEPWQATLKKEAKKTALALKEMLGEVYDIGWLDAADPRPGMRMYVNVSSVDKVNEENKHKKKFLRQWIAQTWLASASQPTKTDFDAMLVSVTGHPSEDVKSALTMAVCKEANAYSVPGLRNPTSQRRRPRRVRRSPCKTPANKAQTYHVAQRAGHIVTNLSVKNTFIHMPVGNVKQTRCQSCPAKAEGIHESTGGTCTRRSSGECHGFVPQLR